MYQYKESPKIDYDGQLLFNNTLRFKINSYLKNNIIYFEQYRIEDGETPENVAYDFYGDSKLNWILLTINNIIDPFHDWFIPNRVFRDVLITKYLDDPSTADDYRHFEDEQGNIIPDPITESLRAKYGVTEIDYILSQVKFYRKDGEKIIKPANENEQALYAVTNLEYEEEENDKRALINIVRPAYIGKVVTDVKSLLSEVK